MQKFKNNLINLKNLIIIFKYKLLFILIVKLNLILIIFKFNFILIKRDLQFKLLCFKPSKPLLILFMSILNYSLNLIKKYKCLIKSFNLKKILNLPNYLFMNNFLLLNKYYNLKLKFIIKSELIFFNLICKLKICLNILKDYFFIKCYNYLNNIELKAQKLNKNLKLKKKILKIKITNYWEIINNKIIKPYKIIVVIINFILIIKYFYLNRDLNILILLEKIFIENNLNQYLDKVLNLISYNLLKKNIINIIINNYNYLYDKYLFIMNYLIWLLLFLNNLIFKFFYKLTEFILIIQILIIKYYYLISYKIDNFIIVITFLNLTPKEEYLIFINILEILKMIIFLCLINFFIFYLILIKQYIFNNNYYFNYFNLLTLRKNNTIKRDLWFKRLFKLHFFKFFILNPLNNFFKLIFKLIEILYLNLNFIFFNILKIYFKFFNILQFYKFILFLFFYIFKKIVFLINKVTNKLYNLINFLLIVINNIIILSLKNFKLIYIFNIFKLNSNKFYYYFLNFYFLKLKKKVYIYNKYYIFFSLKRFKVISKINKLKKIKQFNLTIKNNTLKKLILRLNKLKTRILTDYNYYKDTKNLKIEGLQLFSTYPFLFIFSKKKKNQNKTKLLKFLSYNFNFNFQFKKYLKIFKHSYNILFVINFIYILINVIGIICFGFFFNILNFNFNYLYFLSSWFLYFSGSLPFYLYNNSIYPAISDILDFYKNYYYKFNFYKYYTRIINQRLLINNNLNILDDTFSNLNSHINITNNNNIPKHLNFKFIGNVNFISNNYLEKDSYIFNNFFKSKFILDNNNNLVNNYKIYNLYWKSYNLNYNYNFMSFPLNSHLNLFKENKMDKSLLINNNLNWKKDDYLYSINKFNLTKFNLDARNYGNLLNNNLSYNNDYFNLVNSKLKPLIQIPTNDINLNYLNDDSTKDYYNLLNKFKLEKYLNYKFEVINNNLDKQVLNKIFLNYINSDIFIKDIEFLNFNSLGFNNFNELNLIQKYNYLKLKFYNKGLDYNPYLSKWLCDNLSNNNNNQLFVDNYIESNLNTVLKLENEVKLNTHSFTRFKPFLRFTSNETFTKKYYISEFSPPNVIPHKNSVFYDWNY